MMDPLGFCPTVVGGGGTFSGDGASGSWESLDSSEMQSSVQTFPALDDSNYFADVSSAAGGAAWTAGLNGGSNPIFYSGDGALEYANTLGGTTMQDTVIGGALARLPPSIPTNVLNGIGSATFALNAVGNGSATAV